MPSSEALTGAKVQLKTTFSLKMAAHNSYSTKAAVLVDYNVHKSYTVEII